MGLNASELIEESGGGKERRTDKGGPRIVLYLYYFLDVSSLSSHSCPPCALVPSFLVDSYFFPPPPQQQGAPPPPSHLYIYSFSDLICSYNLFTCFVHNCESCELTACFPFALPRDGGGGGGGEGDLSYISPSILSARGCDEKATNRHRPLHSICLC
jgi:hypothetical protein